MKILNNDPFSGFDPNDHVKFIKPSLKTEEMVTISKEEYLTLKRSFLEIDRIKNHNDYLVNRIDRYKDIVKELAKEL